MSKLRIKISLQLFLAIIISFFVSLVVLGMALNCVSRINVVLDIEHRSPIFIIAIFVTVFVISVGIFAFTFFLIINRKIKYLKYISQQVKDITHEGFGSKIEIRGNDEISDLCLNINIMSQELKSKFDYEREIENSKSELICDVSHDLRTPLTSIKGYLQLLKDKQYKTLEELETYINIAFGRTEMLEDLIENLFEYTKLQGKDINLNYKRLCLNDIVRQIVLDYGPLFDKDRLNLQTSIPNDKYFVKIDPEIYVRVIGNLLGNALKYSLKPGNVSVSLCAENNGVKMTITNRANSIDSESLAHLFDRFYRLEKSRSKETGGTGLGLAIAKSIVELHGGSIWAETQNETLSFNVWQPLS
ncbi:sensor histidine kinase YycG [Desulfosporosinus acididurans]|uniref:histidine kinase n=1 Tax=Desulfosporosinus acididurans TaxID=476652 RepID=A0A0J1FR94_9FIRM|nr:HAMP domain-containing sensor histidine kinase [Desulfosporosinus acididurans]KLU65827.1 sensor histidine kinase YycG [Desulfosporosinus acididurans]